MTNLNHCKMKSRKKKYNKTISFLKPKFINLVKFTPLSNNPSSKVNKTILNYLNVKGFNNCKYCGSLL